MNTLEKLSYLRNCSPFDKLSPAELMQVADSSDIKRFLPGQIVLYKEISITHVHIVVEGEVQYREKAIQGLVGAEGVFLHTTLIDNIVAGDSGALTLAIGRGRFYTIINECPAFTISLARQFTKTRGMYASLEADK